MYNATVQYETKKGNLKTAHFPVVAKSLNEATQVAVRTVKGNGLRQAKRILDTQVVLVGGAPTAPVIKRGGKRRGFFSRLFGRRA